MSGGPRDASVLVLGGGPDAEREVSLESASGVAGALAAAGWTVHEQTIDTPNAEEIASLPGDVVFPVLHGCWGEGGPLQDVLEQIDRPYVGCAATAARLCMDKLATKLVAAGLGIPTPRACVARTTTAADVMRSVAIEPPVVLKPVHEGSSVGLELAHHAGELRAALASLDAQRGPWMIEQAIEGRELTIGLIQTAEAEQGPEPRARHHAEWRPLPPVEVMPPAGMYDYAAKYERRDTRYVVRPELAGGVEQRLGEQAARLATAIGVRDVARADFLLDASGTAWLLEINTMPGFTSSSLLPMAALAAGIDMPTLATMLVERALSRGSTAHAVRANRGA